MDQVLLERDDTLAALIGAVEDAAAGHGSVALVSGGAGIGKTSVVRAFAREAAGRARVLLSLVRRPDGAADARPAARRRAGVAAARWRRRSPTTGRSTDVFTAVMAELAAAPPTALVVEDVHWADDATLDVLGYVARRIEPCPRVLVLTLPRRRARPVAPAPAPARRASPGARCTGWRCRRSRATAVRRLAAEHRRRRRRRAPRHRRQPVLRHRGAGLAAPTPCPPPSSRPCSPASAASAPTCREALEQLSVVPSRVRFELAAELLGDAHRHARGGRARRRARGLPGQPSRLPPRAGAARDRAQPAGARAAAPERAGPATALQQRAAARPREPDALRRRGGRRRDRARRRAGARRARPARAGSHRQALAHLESVRPHLHAAGRARARGRARRLRLGALQRAPLPRGGRRRAGGGRAV